MHRLYYSDFERA